MALACSLLTASPMAFLSSHESPQVCEVLPKCLIYAGGRKVQKQATFRAVAVAAGNGGGCCGDGGGGCSTHRKSSPSDLSNVGKEFEEMVAKANLIEIEKEEYDCKEMTENITRDIVQEVMKTGPARKVRKRREEAPLDIGAILADARSASMGDEFVFDDLEDRKAETFKNAKDYHILISPEREREMVP